MSLPRVLFVDDETAICTAITKLLAFHGIEVDAVSTGLEARRAIGKGYDALVLDFRLAGGESGDTLYRTLCTAVPAMADRTIFVTGDISEAAQERIEATGCSMLVKPFEMGLLISLIRGVVAASTAAASREAALVPKGSRSA
ncbi:MAG: multi-sensor hybrid histidine kinase [Gemmatimonadetes bacterium]|jgi:DNA-binding response OmpR family regulator|nr:multi-sensor hybrid histidine kinase [Gemmatimonadota bacterium]